MRILLFFFVICFLGACNKKQTLDTSEILAEVYDQRLLKSDVADIFSIEAISQKDPALNVYVERWVRDQIIIKEAKSKIENREAIEKLVNSYQDNLIKLEFERSILHRQMSEEVSQDELRQAYDSDKLIYSLKDPILKISYIQIPKDHEQIVELRKLWRADNWGRLQQICNQYKIKSTFDQRNWKSMAELNTMIPKTLLSSRKLKKNLKFEASISNDEYFLKIWDFKDKNEEPPLEYISDQLSNVILHKRQKKLLKKITEELYEKALKRNHIKVY